MTQERTESGRTLSQLEYSGDIAHQEIAALAVRIRNLEEKMADKTDFQQQVMADRLDHVEAKVAGMPRDPASAAGIMQMIDQRIQRAVDRAVKDLRVEMHHLDEGVFDSLTESIKDSSELVRLEAEHAAKVISRAEAAARAICRNKAPGPKWRA